MNNKRNTHTKKGIKYFVEFILVYFYLLFSSGYGLQNNNGTLSLLVLILIPICFMILYKRVIINQIFIAVSLCIIAIIIFTHVIAQDSLKLSMITILGYISAIMFVLAIRFEDYKEIYLRVMKVLVPFSIICYLVSISAPNIIASFPKIVSKYSGIYVHNLGLCFVIQPLF